MIGNGNSVNKRNEKDNAKCHQRQQQYTEITRQHQERKNK